MRSNSRIVSLSSGCIDNILAECRAFLKKNRFEDDEIGLYLGRVANVLNSYREHFGEDATIRYRIRKRYHRIEFRLGLRGEKFDPLQAEKETDDIGRSVRRELSPLVWNRTHAASYVYLSGTNIVTIATPRIWVRSIIHSPMLWAPILGLVCGFLCLPLPDAVRAIIVDEVATPLQNVVIGVLTGIMGPVILFSMITSVSALKSINDLTDLSFKIVGRFIMITLSVMVVGIAVSLLFYNVTGEGNVDLQVEQIVGLLLGIIPTNLVSPLLEGNMPQIVVLGVALGAALLILENRVNGLKDIITQAHEWIMSLMDIINMLGPAIPFLCIFITVAQGSAADLLNGWEFLVAIYLATTICGAYKLAKVSIKYRVKPSTLWRKLKPVVSKAFAQAGSGAVMKAQYDISERDLGIKPEFSSFWVPMGEAMLNPRITLMLVIPSFLILKYTGTPISSAFLLVLIILVLELSIASPGTTAAWTILFAALGFPSEYVGIFMTYKLACQNYTSAYSYLHVGLELIESADRFGALNVDKLREEKTAA